MSDTLWGVIIGGVITIATTYLNNQKEETRLEKARNHENKNLIREDKLKMLYNVLIPIIEVYEKNKLEKDIAFEDYTMCGEGVQFKYKDELKKIIKENKRHMTVDLIKSFNRADSIYIYEMMHSGLGQQMAYMEGQGQRVLDCMFDDDKEFIAKVEQEAAEIENEYT